jgi:hypothetical protein
MCFQSCRPMGKVFTILSTNEHVFPILPTNEKVCCLGVLLSPKGYVQNTTWRLLIVFQKEDLLWYAELLQLFILFSFLKELVNVKNWCACRGRWSEGGGWWGWGEWGLGVGGELCVEERESGRECAIVWVSVCVCVLVCLSVCAYNCNKDKERLVRFGRYKLCKWFTSGALWVYYYLFFSVVTNKQRLYTLQCSPICPNGHLPLTAICL